MSGWMQVTLCFCFFLSKDLKNPEIVTLKNLTRESAGVYKCTASNDVGEENCTLEVKVHCKYLCVNGYVQNGIHLTAYCANFLLFSKNSACIVCIDKCFKQ